MDEGAIHVAITRRVRGVHVAAFEQALADFARRSLAEPGTRGVHLLYPPPGSNEYGILRSFASVEARDAFYRTPLYREWLAAIEPLVEGDPARRELHGLEAFFRDGGDPAPPWKMFLVTWVGVWPVSMIVPALLVPFLAPRLPGVLVAGAVAAVITAVLTWGAMPVLVRLADPFLSPQRSSR